ncbi:MAG TPA: hypothetical protein VFU59_04560, partial [Candidatus Eisenbacteria bacterium]|nr:hypothetical protein [Candidatus Eisenbacteria bacterium]
VINKDIRYYRDMGFAVEHKTKGPLVVGVRQAVLRSMPGYPEDAVLLNPHVALEGRVVGIGAGYITGIAEEGPGRVEDYEIWPVSAHFRIGTLTGPIHFSIHSLEDLPLVSGGSTVRVGFGLRPGSGVNGWVGLSSGIPYDRLGLVVKTDVNLHRNLTLNLAGRLGSTEGLDENAAAAGLTVRFPHRSDPKTE